MTTEHAPLAVDDDSVLSDVNRHITKAYDDKVYTSNSFPYSSPGHLRAAAHLYGLKSVPLENARVLELGCAGGGNLLPFALAYPKAHAVGVDLSPVQVEQGKGVVDALGVDNLHLHAMSLTDIAPEFGQFDYIIAHGVFSWVPPEVREAMLRIMRENLSPDGIGYISYNTYPGWKAGDIVRDAMLLHSHGAGPDENKLASAKAVLNLLSDGIAASNPLAPSLRAAVAQLRKHSDYYIAHEYLEIFNSPCYLLEFVNMVDQHGLVHVGDSDPHVEMPATFGKSVQLHHSLVALGQPREMRQQYLDFAVGRNFRKSLVVHKERADQVLLGPDTERLTDLRWAGYFTEAEAKPDAPKGQRAFRSYKNQPVYTTDEIVIALIEALSQAWPASVDFNGLAAQVSSRLPQAGAEDQVRQAVLKTLQTLFRLNCLRYGLEASPYDTLPSPRDFPHLVPGLAHMFSQQQDPAFGMGMFNLWHDTVQIQLSEAEAYLLPHIDGGHSRKQLSASLREALTRGTVPAADGKFVKGQRNLDALADGMVGKLLAKLSRRGLLR